MKSLNRVWRLRDSRIWCSVNKTSYLVAFTLLFISHAYLRVLQYEKIPDNIFMFFNLWLMQCHQKNSSLFLQVSLSMYHYLQIWFKDFIELFLAHFYRGCFLENLSQINCTWKPSWTSESHGFTSEIFVDKNLPTTIAFNIYWCQFVIKTFGN